MFFDLVIIGTEHEGVARALAAARSGRRVALIEGSEDPIRIETMRDVVARIGACQSMIAAEFQESVLREASSQRLIRQANLSRFGIQVFMGTARLVSDTTVEVCDAGTCHVMSAAEILIACGTRSKSSWSFPCDGQHIVAAESLMKLNQIPRTCIVIGGGTTGLSTAILLARLGADVTVVDEHVNLLEICTALDGEFEGIQSLPIAFRLGDEAIGASVRSEGQVAVRLASGRVLSAETVVVCIGQIGKTEALNLEAIGVGVDEQGRIWCDNRGRTWVDSISAVGSVVGQRVPSKSPLATMA